MKGFKKENWNVEDVRIGILYFYELYDRVPRLKDFEEFDCLPGEEYVQDTFGGFVELWDSLGYKTKFRYE